MTKSKQTVEQASNKNDQASAGATITAKKAKKTTKKANQAEARNRALRNEDLLNCITQLYLRQGFNEDGFVGWRKFRSLLCGQIPENEMEIKYALAWLKTANHKYSLTPPDVVIQNKNALRQKKGAIQVSQSGSSSQPLRKAQVELSTSLQKPTSSGNPSPQNQNSKPSNMVQPVQSLSSSQSSCRNKAQQTISSQESTSNGIPDPQNQFSIPILKLPLSMSPSEATAPVAVASQAGTTSRQTIFSQQDNVLTAKLRRFQGMKDDSSAPSAGSVGSIGSESWSLLGENSVHVDFEEMDHLLAERWVSTSNNEAVNNIDHEIRHAPLVSGSILSAHGARLIPQYGLLGSRPDGKIKSQDSKLLLNTNIPFSAFICGVQGSGKSHTAACILENALISSPHLGRLETPVSALVFSYGDFSSGGVGFDISEAAFLSAGNPAHPNHHVRKMTVLTSPSNLAIQRYYNQVPNARVFPLKFKSQTLDISAMLTLMAVSEKAEVPLYMAQVEKILRNIATKSYTGTFDYVKFRKELKKCDFNLTQTNMLEMRLGLLESFLDLEGNAPQPTFEPGEVTIIDLSDPFVTPNTACILFKLALQQFLGSKSTGKMVVLDEAHKYMHNTPGSKALNDYLLTIIRLQRHYGARVVISTQEPTLLTDLIALCSLIVIHRFTSPEWYNALKKHIFIGRSGDEDVMHYIESLTTGTALVSSSNAVLGENADGSLSKGAGRLVKLDIRKRVTMDGGQSVTCV